MDAVEKVFYLSRGVLLEELAFQAMEKVIDVETSAFRARREVANSENLETDVRQYCEDLSVECFANKFFVQCTPYKPSGNEVTMYVSATVARPVSRKLSKLELAFSWEGKDTFLAERAIAQFAETNIVMLWMSDWFSDCSLTLSKAGLLRKRQKNVVKGFPLYYNNHGWKTCVEDWLSNVGIQCEKTSSGKYFPAAFQNYRVTAEDVRSAYAWAVSDNKKSFVDCSGVNGRVRVEYTGAQQQVHIVRELGRKRDIAPETSKTVQQFIEENISPVQERLWLVEHHKNI